MRLCVNAQTEHRPGVAGRFKLNHDLPERRPIRPHFFFAARAKFNNSHTRIRPENRDLLSSTPAAALADPLE